jgi:hypothetical protein
LLENITSTFVFSKFVFCGISISKSKTLLSDTSQYLIILLIKVGESLIFIVFCILSLFSAEFQSAEIVYSILSLL